MTAGVTQVWRCVMEAHKARDALNKSNGKRALRIVHLLTF